MSGSQSDIQSINGRTTTGGIEITPIEVNLKSALSSDDKEASPVPRPRVQFNDKVQRFPESGPTSPNIPTPLKTESFDPTKTEVPIKRVDIQTNQGSTQSNAPQIENAMLVQHNGVYSAGPHHDLKTESETLPSKTFTSVPVQPARPSNDWSATAAEPKPLMTNVVLNIDMVRTQKESQPDGGEEEDLNPSESVKVAFSLPASNAINGAVDNNNPTGEQLSTRSDGNRQEEQAAAVNNPQQSKITDQNVGDQETQKAAESTAQNVVDSVIGEGNKLQQIDLSALLKTGPNVSDIAIKNAEANRHSPLLEDDTPVQVTQYGSTAESPAPQAAGHGKRYNIPIEFITADGLTSEDEWELIKQIHQGLQFIEDYLGDYIDTDKFVDIPVSFVAVEKNQNPAEDGSERKDNAGSEKPEGGSQEIILIFEETSDQFDPKSAINGVHKGVKDLPEPSNQVKDEKLVEIVILFEDNSASTDQPSTDGTAKKTEASEQKGSASDAPKGDKEEVTFVDIPVIFDSENLDGTSVLNETHQGVKHLTESTDAPSNERSVEISIDFGAPSTEQGQEQGDSNDGKQVPITVETESSSFDPKNAINDISDEASPQGSASSINRQQGEATGIKFEEDSAAASTSKQEGVQDKNRGIQYFAIPIKIEDDNASLNPSEIINAIHAGLTAPGNAPAVDRPEEQFAVIAIKLDDDDAQQPSTSTGVQNEESKTIEIQVKVEPESTSFDPKDAINVIHVGLANLDNSLSVNAPEDKFVVIEIQKEDSTPSTSSTGTVQARDDGTKYFEIPVSAGDGSLDSFANDIHKGFPDADALPEDIEQKEVFVDIVVVVSVDEPAPAEDEKQAEQIEKDDQKKTQPAPKEKDQNTSADETAAVPITSDQKGKETGDEQKKNEQESEKPAESFEPINVESFGTSPSSPRAADNKKEQEVVAASATSPVAIIPPTDTNDGINYQSSFARPLTGDEKPDVAPEKVDVKPEEVVFQCAFARPMSQEPSPTKKEQSENQFQQQPANQGTTSVNNSQEVTSKQLNDDKPSDGLQQGFAKPLLDDSTSGFQNGFAKPLGDEAKDDKQFQHGFAKPLYEEPKKDEPISYQSTFAKPIEEKKEQPKDSFGKPQQDSEPTTPQWQKAPGQWMDKYDDGETIWDKPSESGIEKVIPILVQIGSQKQPAQFQEYRQPEPPQQQPQSQTPQQQGSQISSQEQQQGGQGGQQTASAQNAGQEQKTTPSSSDIQFFEVPAGSDRAAIPPQGQEQQQALNGSSSKPHQDGPSQQVQTGAPKSQSPQHNQNKRGSDSLELNLQEYEEQLKRNTEEALNLVDKLVESSQKIRQMEREKQEKERREKEASSRSRSRSSSRSRSVQFNEGNLMEANSYRVNPDLLKDANSIAMLPDHRIAIADFENGLTLFNLNTKDVKRVEGGSKWRNPQSLIYSVRAKEFFVLVEYSENEDGKYERWILRFNKDFEYMNRVPLPLSIQEKEVTAFRLCHCQKTGCLYLAASTYAAGYLFELNPAEVWVELYTCRNKTFADIEILAVIGPVTELMVLETNRSYVNILSVYGTEATHVRMLAVSEKPGAFCIDETGHVIVHDKATSKICLHSRISFLRTMEVALMDHAQVRVSAYDGLLAVLCPSKKDLRIYKY